MSLKKFFDSKLHRQIIIFFRENPHSIDSPRGIATWTGLSRSRTRKALDDLVKAGILNSISTPSTSGYSFTQDVKIIDTIKEYLEKK